MKNRFSITAKLLAGFGILMFASIVNGLFTLSTLNENQELNNKNTEIYTPSSAQLQELVVLVESSHMLAKNWIYVDKKSDTPNKRKLVGLIKHKFPEVKSEIQDLSERWEPQEKRIVDSILNIIETDLFDMHKSIMRNLNTVEKYDNSQIFSETAKLVSKRGDLSFLVGSLAKEITRLKIDIDTKSKQVNSDVAGLFSWFQKYVIISLLAMLLLFVITGFFTTRSIIKPLIKLRDYLLLMTKGILPTEKLQMANNEIGDMAEAMNTYIGNMRKTSNFASEIGNGQYDVDFEPLGDDDVLGNSLLGMKDNLQKAKIENEKRKKEDEIRNWITKGLADFGGVLRQHSDNMQELSRNVIIKLIDYLEATQGAIYILNEIEEGKKIFEMQASVAYEREKFQKLHFEFSEGLVGRCAFEKSPVYLKDIPEDYINIVSGLGGAEPNYLLLVPLIINEEVLGVIELASFNEFEKHQIEFVLTLGETIASTISNVRINEQTKALLNESRMRSDELSSQEEELRQNMEELQATQEEASRREIEMEQAIGAINNTLGTIEIDKNGNMRMVNKNLLDTIVLESKALIGKSFQEMFASGLAAENEFIEVWTGLQVAENGTMVTNYFTAQNELWFKHTFTVFRNMNGEINKVVDLVIDITKQKELEKELEYLKQKS